MSLALRCIAAMLAVLGLALPGPLLAARIALVIGNDDYNRFGDLANAGNDARAIARVLRNDLDFELIGGGAQTNIDSQRARQLIKQFGERLGRDDVAFFYFAGHGIGAGQTNFLIPVDDKEINYFEDVPDFAIDAQSVLRRMEQRGEGVNIMILDACRDQGLPQRTRSGEMRGLSRMNAPAGSFIGYAASPGEKAADGKGSNGVFTEQFVRLLTTPGYTLDDVFSELTGSVMKATAGKQTPIRESNMQGRFVLVPPRGTPPNQQAGLDLPVPAPAPTPSPAYEPPPSPVTDSSYGGGGILLKPASLAALPAGTVFQDCSDCPQMVRVPTGSFRMGSPESEAGVRAAEGPMHEVRIGYPLAVGKFEVTRGQWRAFLSDSGKQHGDGCAVWDDAHNKWVGQPDKSWLNPGYAQDDSHPVTCVTWDYIQNYVQWLGNKTGKRYRLLSEAEFEYVNRAGGTSAYPWRSDTAASQCRYANGADKRAKAKYQGLTVASCDDGYAETAPVGRFAANEWGLHDLSGNLWEWTEDCWNDGYIGAPSTGAAWVGGDCTKRVLRGGAWNYRPADLRAAKRLRTFVTYPNSGNGFRLARTD